MPRDDIRINREWETHEQPHRWGHPDLVDVRFGPYEHITITMSVHEDDAERRALVTAIGDLIQGYGIRTGNLKVEPAEKPLHEVLNDSLRGMGRSERVQPVDDECCLACEARSLGLTVCRKRRCGCDHA